MYSTMITLIVVSRGVCLIVRLDSLVCSVLYGLGSHPGRPCGRFGVVVLAYDSVCIKLLCYVCMRVRLLLFVVLRCIERVSCYTE